MILDPVNDADCLGQLTTIARELIRTTPIQTVARRLRTRDRVVRWFQSLPQANDHGDEKVRFIQCDVPQRARLLPDDPNCVERAMGAMMLLELIDPKTPRALATVDKPERHTGLVEQYGKRWLAVDLFPRVKRRDFNWGEFGKDVLQGVHKYVAKPVLSIYGAGGAADWLGDQEDSWIGRDKKKQQEKKGTPPPAKQRTEPAKPSAAESGAKASSAIITRYAGSGASQKSGGKDGEKAKDEKSGSGAGGVASVAGALLSRGSAAETAAAGDRRDSHDAGALSQRFWWWFDVR